jgi:hypothetical protein
MSYRTTACAAKVLPALAVVLLWPQTLSASFIVNGGFEQPAIVDNWMNVSGGSTFITGWTAADGGVQLVKQGAHAEGNQHLDLQIYGSGSVYQDITGLVPGQEYTLSFAMSALIYQTGIFSMDVYWNQPTGPYVLAGTFQWDPDKHTQQAYPNLGFQWDYHQLTLTATASTMRLKFKDASNLLWGVQLDDVRLEPVPEPSCAVLLGGLCVCAAGRNAVRGFRRRTHVPSRE